MGRIFMTKIEQLNYRTNTQKTENKPNTNNTTEEKLRLNEAKSSAHFLETIMSRHFCARSRFRRLGWHFMVFVSIDWITNAFAKPPMICTIQIVSTCVKITCVNSKYTTYISLSFSFSQNFLFQLHCILLLLALGDNNASRLANEVFCFMNWWFEWFLSSISIFFTLLYSVF